jgi:alpha-tubulin suppressor-like RCC1 family protein
VRTVLRFACLANLGSLVVASFLGSGGCSNDDDGTGQPITATDSGNDVTNPDVNVAAETGGGDQISPDADLDAGPKCKTATCALSIAAGPYHTCVILGDHTVKCWGDNPHGELGSGELEGGVVNPKTSLAPALVANLNDALAISAGGEPGTTGYTCVIQTGGAVRCWGSNNLGQLGGGADASISPTGGVIVADAAATAIDLGYRHACMLDTTGALRCWGGTNSFGERGNPQLSVIALPTDGGLTGVSTGNFSTCVVTDKGEVICFGANGGGQVNPYQDASPSAPKLIDAGGPANAVSAANLFTCASLDGGASCWGINTSSQLGRTGAFPFNPPGSPEFALGIAPVSVVGGGTHACAIMEDRGVDCWGANSKGQAGDFTLKATVTAPNGVGGVSKVVQLALGYEHSCALTDDGDIYCWGSNAKGQLGPNANVDGSIDTTPHPDPVKIPL